MSVCNVVIKVQFLLSIRSMKYPYERKAQLIGYISTNSRSLQPHSVNKPFEFLRF